MRVSRLRVLTVCVCLRVRVSVRTAAIMETMITGASAGAAGGTTGTLAFKVRHPLPARYAN
jgi:hypothetical protein